MSFYTSYNLKAEWDFKSHQDSYLLGEWVFLNIFLLEDWIFAHRLCIKLQFRWLSDFFPSFMIL